MLCGLFNHRLKQGFKQSFKPVVKNRWLKIGCFRSPFVSRTVGGAVAHLRREQIQNTQMCTNRATSLNSRSRGYKLARFSRAHVCGSHRLCVAQQTSGTVVSNFCSGRREINVHTGARDHAFMCAAPVVPPLEISLWSPTELPLREYISRRTLSP